MRHFVIIKLQRVFFCDDIIVAFLFFVGLRRHNPTENKNSRTSHSAKHAKKRGQRIRIPKKIQNSVDR